MILSRIERKKFKIKIFFLLLLLGLIFQPSVSAAKRQQVSCKSVIFSDSTKGKRLYGKNVQAKVLPASTTKVMTALVVLERLSLDKYVGVSSMATGVEPSKIYLKPGEAYKVKDLLYAALISSANDASVVLAEAVAGSEEKFVELMNARARKLGARHTKFANANGLSVKNRVQYTTAYDMYLIFKEALKYDFFRTAIKYRYKTIFSKEGRKISFTNHNKILFKGWKEKIYGKTGYTRAAEACFVGTLERGKSTFIIAVFGCDQRWDDIKYIVSRYGGVPL